MSFFTPAPPNPVPTDPLSFRTRAINLFTWITGTMLSEMETLNTDTKAAAAALTLNSVIDTSASSVLIGTGSKSFTVSASKSYAAGMWLSIADTAAPTTNSMVAQVTSYSGTALAVNVPSNGVRGSGTKTAWVISLTAAPSTEIAATFSPVSSAASLAASRTALGASVSGNTVFTGTPAGGLAVLAAAAPAFSASLTTNQTLTSGAFTKVQLATEAFDTSNAFDTTTFRYTPQVAGYYLVTAKFSNEASTTISRSLCAIYKNGAESDRLGDVNGAGNGIGGATLIFLNGSTDYIEMFAFVVATTPILNSGAVTTWMKAVLVKAT